MIAEILGGMKLLGTASRVIGKIGEQMQNESTADGVSKEDFQTAMTQAMEKLKNESSDTVADTASEPEKISLEKLFDFLDVNKDGTINQEEFQRMKVLINYARLHIK